MTDRSVFKGVLWDHGAHDINGTTLYKTVIVGVILSTEPLTEATKGSHFLHAGKIHNLQTAFADIRSIPASYLVGDALDVLSRLNDF